MEDYNSQNNIPDSNNTNTDNAIEKADPASAMTGEQPTAQVHISDTVKHSDQNCPREKIGGYYNDKGNYIFLDGSFYDIFGNYHPSSVVSTDTQATYAFNWTATPQEPTQNSELPMPNNKKKHSAFKVTLIVMACVFAIAFLILSVVLITGIFDALPDASKNNIEVNITVSDKGPTKPEDGLASAELLEQVNNSVVVITNQMTSGQGLGSGFIISPDGYIVTNAHVVEDSKSLHVDLYDGSSYEAKIVGTSDRDDIAVLKINAKDLPAITLGQSKNCYIGERVYAIGSPDSQDLSWTVTMGIISHTNRKVKMYDDNGNVEKIMTLIQSDVAVNHGNSGGPLINTRGEVVGIVTLKMANTAGLGFAIPIDNALTIITALIKNGNADNIDSSVSSARPMIGITCIGVSADTHYYVSNTTITPITEDKVSNFPAEDVIYAPVGGIYVMELDSKYNAKDVLKKGDIIVSLDNTTVYTNSQLSYYLNNYSAGDEITLKVYRDGKYINVKLTLAKEIK